MKSKYPKSAISIHVLVLENDGGILPLAVNAASLALIHSGIELSDTVVAAELSCLDNVLIYDLSLDEERDLLEWESRSGRRFSHRKSFFAVMPNLNQITSYSVLGETNVETIAKEMSVCMETANTTMTLFQKALVAVTKDEQQHQ